ncbi:hypothetical protein Ciccas_006056 [Cichlidogyrus casuarinus]|uniref:SET domain-containing protein n=1 Tax=Cichlidogyrus casuarinus TaxID=1844966 RepID=A0ABD2Q7E3_9PLAT
MNSIQEQLNSEMSLKGFYKILRSRVTIKESGFVSINMKNEECLSKQLAKYRRLLQKHYPKEPNIYVENTVDFEVPPVLDWINDYVYSPQVAKPFESSIGCKCNTTSKSHCNCLPGCTFRIIQNGRKHPLCIFRTLNGCGWGLKAVDCIPLNTFVMEYLGEVIPHEEAERRGKLYDSQTMTYLFDLDFHGEAVYTVDASKYCNISHFINHSCDPNLIVRAALINHFDVRLHRLAFFTRKIILAGQELTFDYKMNCPDQVIGERFYSFTYTLSDLEKISSESASEFSVSDATSSVSFPFSTLIVLSPLKTQFGASVEAKFVEDCCIVEYEELLLLCHSIVLSL